MSVLSQLGAALGALAAAAALVSLWRVAESYTGPVRQAYRCFAVVAGFWGVGVIVAQIVPAQAGAEAIPLSYADIPSLFAAVLMLAGLVLLGRPESAALPGLRRAPWRDRARLAASITDAFIVSAAVFLIGWLAIFGAAFAHVDTGAGTFAIELVRPLTEAVLLGVGLPLAALAGRRGLLPYLAIVAITVGDALTVGARLSGVSPGLSTQVAEIAGVLLLARAPRTTGAWPTRSWWLGTPPAGTPDAARAEAMSAAQADAIGAPAGGADPTGGADGVTAAAGGPSRARIAERVTTLVAAGAGGMAALVLLGWLLAGAPLARPITYLVAAAIVLAFAFRAGSLVLLGPPAPGVLDEPGQFQQLADLTSDAVLLCDGTGRIRYASRAVMEFGYAPGVLAGTVLTDLLHPEDRSRATQAVGTVLAEPVGDQPSRYGCRVRAADGTWRYVEATVSRLRQAAGPDHLVVTAHDISDKVALRRQVAQLTFHDGLTGLPNRVYAEQRVHAALRHGSADGGTVRKASERGAAEPSATAVIFIDIDQFATVNDQVGRSAGDVVLSQFAHRLRTAVPPQDIVARWGGDQFAVIVEGPATSEEAVDLAGRIARGIAAAPFRLGEREIELTVGVGVAFCAAVPAGHTWQNADLALARAKAGGKGRVEVYVPLPGRDKGEGVSESETRLLSG